MEGLMLLNEKRREQIYIDLLKGIIASKLKIMEEANVEKK